MTSLITADLHLDDNPRNADRWNLLPWIREQVKKHKVDEVIVCGDLTDAKDRHSALLTNRFVDEFAELAKITNVYLLRGNHDYIAEDFPFFMFMRRLASSLDFVREPLQIRMKDYHDAALLLPNTKNYKEEWKNIDFDTFDYVFCHQTFDGAKAENGQPLSGIPPSFFKAFKGQVYSGDVHVPQKVSQNIEYVGAPYRIHFGDSFEPRVLLLQKGKATDLRFPGRPRELVVAGNLRDVQKADHALGSQVKVRVLLRRGDFPEWPKLRREIVELAKERAWELCGLELQSIASKDREVERDEDGGATSPEETLKRYSEAKRLPKEMHATGLELLKEAEQ